jgi:hypothetical protein
VYWSEVWAKYSFLISSSIRLPSVCLSLFYALFLSLKDARSDCPSLSLSLSLWKL